jgi:hypothetical protein
MGASKDVRRFRSCPPKYAVRLPLQRKIEHRKIPDSPAACDFRDLGKRYVSVV